MGKKSTPTKVDDMKSTVAPASPGQVNSTPVVTGHKRSADGRSTPEASSTRNAAPDTKPNPKPGLGDSSATHARSSERSGATRGSSAGKSVISGLNSSSSASALLAPMIQGPQKRRPA